MAAQTAVTTARIRGRGQLTRPAEVREALHVVAGGRAGSRQGDCCR